MESREPGGRSMESSPGGLVDSRLPEANPFREPGLPLMNRTSTEPIFAKPNFQGKMVCFMLHLAFVYNGLTQLLRLDPETEG